MEYTQQQMLLKKEPNLRLHPEENQIKRAGVKKQTAEKEPKKKSLLEKMGLFKDKDNGNEVLLEYIEVNLDKCGKHLLVLGLLVPQLASVATICLIFSQFQLRECNPAVVYFKVPSMELFMLVNLVISICFKFGSLVCLRLALEEY